MSVAPNVNKKRRKTESKPQSQLNKCLNEKRRREQENIYIEELAELISASTSDMSSLSVKPDKCAILQETVNQIRLDKQLKPELGDDLQQSEVSSSKPTILTNDIYGPLLLEALDGFLFVVNIDGKIEFVSENITAFLKYNQEEIVDKSIYTIIHTHDRARFSSNLLPMMSLGNGRDSSSSSESASNKSRSFNCRFLVKSESPSSMDGRQSPREYENMQVSAVFFPFANDEADTDEQQNRLACVARRIPPNEKSPSAVGVEQFTTRTDKTGKILDIDTSGTSSTYNQYLNKDVVGKMILEFCHPSDLPKLKQHLKDVLDSGSSTSVVYKFQVGEDRYVQVQTKSKKFNGAQSSGDFVLISTHSIIRDSDSPAASSDAGGSVKLASSLGIPSSDAAATVNGSAPPMSSLPSTSSATTYANFSFSPNNNSEYELGDLVMEMFPGSSWAMPPQKDGAGRNSPAAMPRSPFESPGVEGKQHSPLSAKVDSRDYVPVAKQEKPAEVQNQKLRHLLTQNMDEARGFAARRATQSEVMILAESRAYEITSGLDASSSSVVVPRTAANVILRDLLNQADDDTSEVPLEPIDAPLLCKPPEAAPPPPRLGNNNMLRKLLNNDDVNRNYRKSQDLIHQLLVGESGDKASMYQNASASQGVDNSVPKPASDLGYLPEPLGSKRKSIDKSYNSAAKRQNIGGPHAHLAGQNPMLASMLAQTPRTPPTVPTSVASSIMTQTPQERLPKNLEKKLVHTPYTSSATQATESRGGRVLPQRIQAHRAVQQQPNPDAFLEKMLSQGDGIGVATVASTTVTASPVTVHGTPVFIPQNSVTDGSNLTDILNDVALDTDSISDCLQTNQTSDPGFAEILEQIYSLQEDLNVETPQGTDDRGAILKLLSEVMEQPSSGRAAAAPVVASAPPPPPPPMVAATTAAATVQDINEKIAISAIQKQLMSFEGSMQPAATATSQSALVDASLLPDPLALILQQQQQPQASLEGAATRAPPRLPVTAHELLSAQQRRGLQLVRNSYVNLQGASASQIRKTLIEKQRLYLQQQQKRLLEQQQRQQLTLQTQQPSMDLLNTTGNAPFPENMNELLNNTVAPNVTLLRSASAPEGGVARFALPSPPIQLSPGQTPPPSYAQAGGHSTSPVSSPRLGAASPQWGQRTPTNTLQLQNPMLNAQLSQSSGQVRLTAQQRQQLALRSLKANPRSQGYAGTAVSSEANFPPLSPVQLIQGQQQQQQRVQRTLSGPGRVGPQHAQATFVGGEVAISPLSSPSYSQTSASTTFVSLPSHSLAQSSQHFSVSPAAIASDSLRQSPSTQASSEFVKQELRAIVGARTQSLSASLNPSERLQPLSRETLEQLGLSVEELMSLAGCESQQGSQALLGSIETSTQAHTLNPRMEEPKQADQKKSLLQQLLSEPT